MKANEIIQESLVDEGPLDYMRQGWRRLKHAYRGARNQVYGSQIFDRLRDEWREYAAQVDDEIAPGQRINWSIILQKWADSQFSSVESRIPVPKLSGPGLGILNVNTNAIIDRYIWNRTFEYINNQQQPAKATVPPEAPAPERPAAKTAAAPAEPDIVPQDSAGPSRMVSVHPYMGGSYAYNVINNQWINNRTNKVITDPYMIKQLNISYNKANQRQTPYNMTPADKFARNRDLLQRQAAQRARSELGVTQ
jgi:hypothetical protein